MWEGMKAIGEQMGAKNQAGKAGPTATAARW